MYECKGEGAAQEDQQPMPEEQSQCGVDSEGNESQQASGCSSGGKGAPRLSFKGNPGNIGFQRRLEIVKAVLAHPMENFMKKGKRTETFKKVCNALNPSDIFAGQLRWEQVQDKFKEGEDQAEAIIDQGEERWIKLRENGGSQMNELDQLYMDLAGNMKEYKRQMDREQAQQDENCKTANANLAAAMETTRKRYDAAATAGAAVDTEDDESPNKRSGDDGAGGSGSGSGSGKKREASPSLGRGKSEGAKRHNYVTNAGLKLDADNLRCDFSSSTGEMIEFLRGAMREEGKDREASNEAKRVKAEAAKTAAEAAIRQADASDKQATAALMEAKTHLLDRIIKCHELGIPIPPELLASLKQ
jgi:hypothetical protein